VGQPTCAFGHEQSFDQTSLLRVVVLSAESQLSITLQKSPESSKLGGDLV
jgi:hypothetical protein